MTHGPHRFNRTSPAGAVQPLLCDSRFPPGPARLSTLGRSVFFHGAAG